MIAGPKTLLEAVEFFKDEENCIRYLGAKRWPDGVVKCPTCGSDRVSFLANQKRWQCSNRHPRRQFSIKVGTIMEDSPIGLDKWLPVMWLIANCRNGISSWEIHRDLGVTQKTAWFMLHRIRLAMQDEVTGGKLAGEVEVDETFIGGKARNMHKNVKARKLEGKGGGKVGKIGVGRDGLFRLRPTLFPALHSLLLVLSISLQDLFSRYRQHFTYKLIESLERLLAFN
jgi:transposase-like protein